MSDNETSPLSPAVSPLLEADPSSINEFISQRIDAIFNKPPLLLSDDDLRIAVEYYRKERNRFMIESANKANKEPVRRGAKKVVPKSVSEAMSTMEDLL